MNKILICSVAAVLTAAQQYQTASQPWQPYGFSVYTPFFMGSTAIKTHQESVTQLEVFKSTDGCISGLKISSLSGSITEGIRVLNYYQRQHLTDQAKAPPDASCSSSTLCLTQTLTPSQKIVKVTATASDHRYCIDSLSFHTNDTQDYSCNAREGTSSANYNLRPLSSPKVFDFPPTGELANVTLATAYTECVIRSIQVEYKDACLYNDPSLISLDISAVNLKIQNIITGSAEEVDITASSICNNVDYSLLITPDPITSNLITLSSTKSTTKMKFAHSDNLADANVYTVKLQAKYTGQSSWLVTSDPVIYEYVNPCKTATITATDYPHFKTSVLSSGSSSTQIWTDSVSQAVSSSNQLCGPFQITKTAIEKPSTYVEATMSQHLTQTTTNSQSIVTSKPTLIEEIGDYVVQFLICLQNYAEVTCATINLAFSVTPCVISSFIALSPSNDQTYTIGDTALSWSALDITTQSPACGYAQEFTVSVAPEFQSAASFTSTSAANKIDFTFFSQNIADAGEHTITVTSTVLNYHPVPAAAAPSTSKIFKLKIINSCLTSTITASPAQVESFVVFAGYPVASLQKYAFNDTVTIQKGQPTENLDFCGPKIIKVLLNGTETNWFTVPNQDNITLSPPEDTALFGVAQGLINVSLEQDTSIKQEYPFDVTILGYEVPLVASQFYTLGSSPLSISYEPFEVLPTGYNPGQSKVEACLLQSGATLDGHLDLNSSLLKKITDLSWISLDSLSNQLLINSDDSSLRGEHTIVLVQSFENFPEVNPYSKFKLTIYPKVVPAIAKRVAPSFQPPIPAQIKVNQCGNQTEDTWVLQIPSTFDSNDSLVNMSVQLDIKYFSYDQGMRTISQLKKSEAPVNQTIRFTLTNEMNLTQTYTLSVQFSCQALSTAQITNLSFKYNITEPKVKIAKPAQIASISRGGQVEIRFTKAVFVPNFTLSQLNLTQQQGNRRLQQSGIEDSLGHYINKEVLQVQLRTQYNLSDVDWQCTNFTNNSLGLWINFTNPMEISQTHQDQLVLSFIKPERFLLESAQEYLFSNDSVKTLIVNIPPQFPSSSKSTTVFLQSVTDSVQQVGVTVIIVTLLVQIIAKKVITSMWLYYASLQLVLLIAQRINLYPPSSVDIVTTSISGIINLTSLDKNQIASFLHLDAIANNPLFLSLDGVALSAIGILVFVLFCGITMLITKKFPKVYNLLLKIRDFIFWNFLIRYFQASFIGFNYAALSNVQKAGATYKEITPSAVILAIQYAVVCFIAYLLIRKELIILGTSECKKRIGNLYQNLDTRERHKVLFGLIFFVQRILVVCTVAIKQSFGVQWQICQFVLLLNTVYIHETRPYADPDNATLDYINCWFLLSACLLTATFSSWNTDSEQRFTYGMAYDALVCLQFLVNLVYVIIQAGQQLILWFKRMHYRCKQKSQRKAQAAKKSDSTIKVVTQSEPDKSQINLRQIAIETLGFDESEFFSLQKQLARKSNKQITIVEHSDLSEIEEEKEQQAYESSSLESDQLQSYHSPNPVIAINITDFNQDKYSAKAQLQQFLANKQTNQHQQQQIRSQTQANPVTSPYSQQNFDDQHINKNKNELQKRVFQSHGLGTLSGINQKSTSQPWKSKVVDDLQQYVVKTTDQPHNLVFSLQRDLNMQHEQQQLKRLNDYLGISSSSQQVLGRNTPIEFESIPPLAPAQSYPQQLQQPRNDWFVLQQHQFQQSRSIPMHRQGESKVVLNLSHENPHQNVNQTHLIPLKTRPAGVSSQVRDQVAQQLASDERQTLANGQLYRQNDQQLLIDREVTKYYASGNDGIRRYPKDKVFTWQADVWPFYKQKLPYYQGHIISEETHRNQVVEHLKQLWKNTYPTRPYLPLFVSPEEYNQILTLIEPEILRYRRETQHQWVPGRTNNYNFI